ncbi:hypothetical protein ACEPAH_4572 [Sanghuangporus vaninii]
MSCVSTPTATQFQTITSTSVSTSFSVSVTTLPGTTSTDLITSCLSSADISLSGSSGLGIGTCVSSTVITSTTVIDGGVSTTQVPFEITDSFTSTVPTNTLFAPCTDNTSPVTTPPTTSPTTSPTTTPTVSTEFSQTSTTVVVTPTTTLTSSQDTTLSDGQITQIVVTFTSLLPPTSSVLSSSVAVATTQANDNDGGSSIALGPIIGGTLGGFAGLILIVGAIWFFRRRRTNWDDIFEKDYEEYSGGKPLTPGRARMLDLEDEPVHPAEANTEPKPYIYGLVGSKTADPPSLDAGLIPVGNASRASLSSHGRTPSTTPLMNNAAASRPGSSGDGNHVSSGANGVSPSPSFTPSAAGGRSGSPGPLGVQIPTGSMFPEFGSESPTSVMGSRGPLFIANQLDPISPPGSPRPASPATPTAGVTQKRASTGMSNVVSAPSLPSFCGGAPVASSSTATGPPPAAYAYLAEKQRQQLARSDTVSSTSVYSQPSRAPTPPPAKALNMASAQRTNSDVVVHTDAGRVAREPNDQPPAYQD